MLECLTLNDTFVGVLFRVDEARRASNFTSFIQTGNYKMNSIIEAEHDKHIEPQDTNINFRMKFSFVEEFVAEIAELTRAVSGCKLQ